jgi:hypothetical protein
LYPRPGIATVTALTVIAVSIAAVTAAAITTSVAAFCQNHVAFKHGILDIGNRRCWIPAAVIRQQVQRDRASGRKGHEQQSRKTH